MGWEPEERHEHYDADGNLTGYTVVTREAEWDDRQRERMLALAYYERGVCDCGFHESVATDRANTFTFETKVCPLCRASAKMNRIQASADETADNQLGEKAPPGAPRAADGRRTFLRQLTPLEVAAQTGPSVAKQAPRQ